MRDSWILERGIKVIAEIILKCAQLLKAESKSKLQMLTHRHGPIDNISRLPHNESTGCIAG